MIEINKVAKTILILSLLTALPACSREQKEFKPAEVSPYFNALEKTKNIAEQNDQKVETETEILSDEPTKEVQGIKINSDVRYYKVLKTVDGDTIDVDVDGKTERIRMIGVNTPESVDPRRGVECFGKEAASKAAELLLGKEISLEADASQDDRDKYGRLLRYVWIKDGLFYNLEIIKRGYAYEYTYKVPYKFQAEFKAAQTEAQNKKSGLWADGACGLNKKSDSNADISTVAGASGCSIKGNINGKGDKIYHLLSCPGYDKTNISETNGERWFCSKDEALRAGWRKAENCK